MDADIHTMNQSDFYRILDFRCYCTDCKTSSPEYSDSFCISFVRKGNFLFHVFRRSLDSYNGCVLITKPGYEHRVTHTHTVPDECTIIEFTDLFFQLLRDHYKSTGFLHHPDQHSTLVKTSSELEFLHFHIIRLILSASPTRLQTDNLILQIIEKVLSAITDIPPVEKLSARLKKNHLATIERAKNYITENFTSDISLTEIASHCYLSPFHFSRIFKSFTNYSPHQFLMGIRLQHAALLLREMNTGVADAAFNSGFNSIDHFTSAFSQHYKCPPGKFRKQASNNSKIFFPSN